MELDEARRDFGAGPGILIIAYGNWDLETGSQATPMRVF
jgi:hypothetical protein